MNEIQIVKGKIKIYGKDQGKIRDLLEYYENAKADQETEIQREKNTIARLEEIFNWQKKESKNQIDIFQKDLNRKIKIIGMIKSCLPEEKIEEPNIPENPKEPIEVKI